MHIRSPIVARDFKSGDRPNLYTVTPPLEALKARTPIAANKKSEHSQSCTSTCHVHMFTQRLRDLCWYLSQSETGWTPTLENGTGAKEHVQHTGRSAIGSVIGKNISKVGDISWTSARRICFDMTASSYRNDIWRRLRARATGRIWETKLQGSIQPKQMSSVTGQRRASRHWTKAYTGESGADSSSTWRDRRWFRTIGLNTIQQLQITRWQMFVLQSRSSRHTTHCQRVVSKNVNASTQ